MFLQTLGQIAERFDARHDPVGAEYVRGYADGVRIIAAEGAITARNASKYFARLLSGLMAQGRTFVKSDRRER